jgi:hypothetical protein
LPPLSPRNKKKQESESWKIWTHLLSSDWSGVSPHVAFVFVCSLNRMKQAAVGGAVAVGALGVVAGLASIMMTKKG